MSTVTELESFIQKFHQLWNAGLTAHLDLDCHDGVASVGLRLQLGHPPPPGPFDHRVYSPPPHRKSFSPSYRRRRERRIASRNTHAEKASTLEETEVTNGNEESAEEVPTEKTVRTEAMKEIEKNDDTFEQIVEIEETGEVLRENDDELITGKTENEAFAIAKKNEDENEEVPKSSAEVSCAASNSLGKNSDERYEHVELEVKDEGFIGPRLPRVMSNEEFKTLMDKLLGYKYYS